MLVKYIVYFRHLLGSNQGLGDVDQWLSACLEYAKKALSYLIPSQKKCLKMFR